MPIYEYACKNCGHTLDELQKISDEPLVDCPECGQPELKRLLSAPRFRLKGAGWYETDFKKDNQRNLSKADGESSSGSGKSDTSSGEKSNGAKPAGESAAAKPAEKSSDSKPAAAKATEKKSPVGKAK